MMLTLDQALTGISGILVTPYDAAGEVAPARLAPILDRALGAGLHMPVVNGNTGEFYALTTEEASWCAKLLSWLTGGRRCWQGSDAAFGMPWCWQKCPHRRAQQL